MPFDRHTLTDGIAALVVLSLITSATVAAGVGIATTDRSSDAAKHGADNGNYTVKLPSKTDHYPRNENPGGEHNASIHHYAGFTVALFEERGIPYGIENLSYIWITNQDIDFSQCTTENTASFGIDRDSDDPGSETDVDLLRYRENTDFNQHSIVVDFFDGDEIAAQGNGDNEGGDGKESEPGTSGEGRGDGDNNAEVYPDDQVIAVQGEGSAGGPCYAMPEEPGWYQIQGYGNGTGWNGEFAEVHLPSHYFYVCVCDNESHARQKLGPPPSEQDGESTPTESDTPTATESGGTTPTDPGGSTPTDTDAESPTDGESPTPTSQAGVGTPTETGGSTPTDTDAESPTDADGGLTPTGAGGEGAPGFGVFVAILALVAAALLRGAG